ncbi:MAG: helix-turn-helix domain-containing protein [Ktedonobacteraceae bacterium]|nr:helix-turn-helix domain-containing protein [Ktedonobacteraceae bacterium]MBO0791993.1 helix-turn-helix domain-containing protein [Ktedonobacteraceae bacterium]
MPEEYVELLTAEEVAQKLRVDATTVRRWVKTGALTAVTLPNLGKRQAYRFRKDDLERLLNVTL